MNYQVKEIDPRVAYLRELNKELADLRNTEKGQQDEEALMLSMQRGSVTKKSIKDGFGSNLSVVKTKPVQRQSMMNDSVWSGMTSIKHDLAIPRLT
jgi:hypothetical protein